MADLSGPFAPNGADVVSKIIDGELIIIRLSDGTYYSMDNVGARAWTLIEHNHDLPAMVAAIASAYEVSPAALERDLRKLLDDLLAEGLIVAAPDTAATAAPRADAAPTPRLGYEAPQLHIYRDMGNLLALDPPTPGIDDMPLKGGKYR
jgi:coenzyme PQQ synthesis protein D (PqqD)